MRERRQSKIAALFAFFVAAATGCSSGASTSSELLDATYSPRAPLSAAVSDLMTADQSGVYKTSYALLTPDSRKKYADVVSWQEHRKSLPPIKSFHLEGATKDTQTVVVERDVSQREIWKGKKYRNGWLVQAEPVVTR